MDQEKHRQKKYVRINNKYGRTDGRANKRTILGNRRLFQQWDKHMNLENICI